jgi:enterochelin esterase-like enzyme
MLFCIVVALLVHGNALFSEFLQELERTAVRDRAPLVTSFLATRSTPIVEHDTLLHFVWFGVADSVMVNGTLQSSWRSPVRLRKIACGDSLKSPGLFYRTFIVPSDARIEYKFIVNNEYQLDARNRRVTPPGDFLNSEVAMPAFHMSPLHASVPGVPRGHVDTLVFASANPSIKARHVLVYVPPGYDKLKDLPTIYVHDGMTAIRYSYYPTIIENMIARGLLPPIIAVFVPGVDRDEEYKSGKLRAYIGAVSDELVPMVDRMYRTAHAPESRAVAGISDGGHLALMTGFIRPDLFRCVAGQSSTIGPSLRTYLRLRQKYDPLPASMKIWTDCGTYDIVQEEYNFPELNRTLSQELTRYGVPHRYLEVHEGHDWSSWRERLPAILRFFFSR